MRYSIMGATIQQVRAAGGLNIKEAPRTKIIFATLTGEQAAKLRSAGFTVAETSGVKTAVMPPVPVAGIATYTPQYLLELARLEWLREATVPPVYGEGFNLAVLDTGIRETHEQIEGHIVFSKNYTSDPMRDGFDHGTNVCSVILAVAPKCGILNMKVLDDEGSGTEEEVVLAIDDCISLQETQPEIAPSMINISLGGLDDGNPDDPLRVACRAALERGIWISAAAGNEGPDSGSIMSPACEQYVGAIGSVGVDPFTVNSWSSRGPTVQGLVKPDICMFGENIQMASSESDVAVVGKSGTSFSCPFASAVGLLTQESIIRRHVFQYEIPSGYQPGVADPIDRIMDFYIPRMCAKPEGAPADKDNAYGWGTLFGDLIYETLARPALIDVGTLLSGMVAIMMMTMMMKVIK